MDQDNPGPITSDKRIGEIDVLRGVALFGVLAMNLVYFAGDGQIATKAQLDALPTAAFDLVIASDVLHRADKALPGQLAAALASGGLLIAVVVLPLFAPPVIFAAGALSNAAAGLEPWSALLLLAAYALAAVALTPFAMAAAVRNALG